MPSTPFVNSSIRTAIPNPCEGLQQILVKVIYENERGRGPVQSIEAYASPIVSFNYNASYLNRNDMLTNTEDGFIRPISLFNYNQGLWSIVKTYSLSKIIYSDMILCIPQHVLPTVTRFFITYPRNIFIRRRDYRNRLVVSSPSTTRIYVRCRFNTTPRFENSYGDHR